MKCNVYIGETTNERVDIYANKRTKLINEIEELALCDEHDFVGTNENGEKFIFSINDITAIISSNNKTYIIVDNNKYLVKLRLYQYEELYKNLLIKLNQSCLANIKKIKKFKCSIGGSILVIFKDDYNDYISRRELKKVKERLGI